MQFALFALLSQIIVVTSFYVSINPSKYKLLQMAQIKPKELFYNFIKGLKKANLNGEITGLNITCSNDQAMSRFPKNFEITLKHRLIKFIRVKNNENNPIGSANIYTTNSNGQVNKFKTKSNNEVNL